jgi:hypothetical protein
VAPDNENHYDTHRYAGDQAADTRRVMNRMPDEDRSTRQQIQQSINSSQAAELAPAVRMGDDRVIGDTPNWDSFDSEQLYGFATQKNSPTTADDLGRAFNAGGNSLVEAANGLFDAVSQLDGAWSGVAADSARGALAPLARAAGLAGQTAQMMGVQMSQQSVAATEVRKLPPPRKFDQAQSLNAMVAGGPAAMQQDLKAQKDAADAVKREQISYLDTYTASMSAVDAQTPSFVPPRETIGGGTGGTTRVTGGEVHVPTTSAPVDRGTTTGAPASKHTGVAAPGGSAGWTDDTGQTDQSGYAPVPGLGTGTSGFNPGGTPVSTAPNTFGPGGPGGLGGPLGGPGANAVPGAGAGGFGGGFGSFGNPGGAAGGPGAGGGPGSGGAPGTGGPRGVTPAGMGGAGRGNPAGTGGVPRGKGDDEEDTEHGRPSYLVEGDPESTFGNDQLTAPAVIGGDDD